MVLRAGRHSSLDHSLFRAGGRCRPPSSMTDRLRCQDTAPAAESCPTLRTKKITAHVLRHTCATTPPQSDVAMTSDGKCTPSRLTHWSMAWRSSGAKVSHSRGDSTTQPSRPVRSMAGGPNTGTRRRLGAAGRRRRRCPLKFAWRSELLLSLAPRDIASLHLDADELIRGSALRVSVGPTHTLSCSGRSGGAPIP